MEKKPVNVVVKDASEAAKRLNEFVEKGGFKFDIGVNNEYVTTVIKNSDGTSTSTKKRVYRIIGFVDIYTGSELNSLNEVRAELENVKKERTELNRTLNVMNKSAFAPISVFLLIISIFTLFFGIMTLAKVLPLPANQIPIAVILVIVGVLALAGSIALFIHRKKKKNALLENKDKILLEDEKLKEKERSVDSRTPQWYKDALWSSSGNTFKNSSLKFTLKE